MNKYIKLVVAAILIGLGIYMMFFTREIGWGIVVFFLSAFPIFLFFKNELILISFWFFRKQNIEKASHWLNQIKNYRSQLHKSQYGYFHYLQGFATPRFDDRLKHHEPSRLHRFHLTLYRQFSNLLSVLY